MQVAKQWYDYERGAYHFVHVARELQSPLLCKRVSDFDMNGIFYWIGSNARSVSLSLSLFLSFSSPSPAFIHFSYTSLFPLSFYTVCTSKYTQHETLYATLTCVYTHTSIPPFTSTFASFYIGV